jgi:2-amino-4-hydroxy-6-hydroxymethyldihydropteridine diphosphokinase
MNAAVRVYIGIGSNLGDPLSQVQDVMPMLDHLPQTRLLASSSLYRSEPVSDIEQDDYINAVVAIETGLPPEALLLELQALENAFYRRREPDQHWGPRSMDLDILLYGQHRLNDSHLVIPHPEMHRRLFVLLPLQEIAGDLYLPGLGSLSYLAQQAPAIDMQRIEPEKTVA